MSIKVKDRVRETTIVTGTGAATLLGPVTKLRSFSSQFNDGDQTSVLIIHRSKNEWEVSHPIYSANTIDRTNVQSSSNNGAPVNFSPGTKDVFCNIDAAILQTLINGGGGGLTDWSESLNTTSPNDAIPVVALTANNAATNVDVAIVAKGNGGFAVQIADGTAVGGNKRGQHAVDLQSDRSDSGNPSHVANGPYSVIGGGTDNMTTGGGTTISGGSSNTATGNSSTVAGGTGNQAAGSGAFVGGGAHNQANGRNSAAFGNFAVANNVGQIAHAAGRFVTAGDAQASDFTLLIQTSDATPTQLFLDGLSSAIAVPTNGAMTFRVTVTAKIQGAANPDGTSVGAWSMEGLIFDAAGVATIAGSNVSVLEYNGFSTLTAPTVTGDGAGNMAITVVGIAATNINWVARVETTEVIF